MNALKIIGSVLAVLSLCAWFVTSPAHSQTQTVYAVYTCYGHACIVETRRVYGSLRECEAMVARFRPPASSGLKVGCARASIPSWEPAG